MRAAVDPSRDKQVASIHEALVKCGIRDGMVLSFHHHFRDGRLHCEYGEGRVARMGIRDITICASSLGAAHDPVARMIEEGIVTGIHPRSSWEDW